jgi:hypothetical protein
MKLYRIWCGHDDFGADLGYAWTYDYKQALRAYGMGLVVHELPTEEDKWTTIMFNEAEIIE